MSQKKETRVFILHGFESSPHRNWFPWLKETIELETPTTVQIVPFPNPNYPVLSDWKKTLGEMVHSIDERTIFVAHSLGCVTLLHYLSAQQNLPNFAALYLVSGFDQPVKNLPELDKFISDGGPIDFAKIKAASPTRVVVTSVNDQIVPTDLTVAMAHHLDAKLYQRHSGGHFMTEEGYETFPLLYDILSQQLDHSTTD